MKLLRDRCAHPRHPPTLGQTPVIDLGTKQSLLPGGVRRGDLEEVTSSCPCLCSRIPRITLLWLEEGERCWSVAPWFLQPDPESSEPHLSVWATLRVGSPFDLQSSSFMYGADRASGTREGQFGSSVYGTTLAGRGRKRVGSVTPPVG